MDFEEQIKKLLKEYTGLNDIILETPPDSKLGDFSFPCFQLIKKLSKTSNEAEKKKKPNEIAIELAQKIAEGLERSRETQPDFIEEIKTVGPYLNFFLNSKTIAQTVITEIQKDKENYGKLSDNEIILVESPGPNTNKPLHLGHLRNILLGQSISNILEFIGKNVHIVNVVNDRGIHICKSMLAYQKFGDSLTPQKTGKKPDHFVGDYYVKYAQESKNYPEMEKEVRKLLNKWEKKDPEVMKLWKKMNKWAMQGFKKTYQKLNFKIEKEYFESKTYKGGRDIILKGLEKGIFQKDKDNSIIIDLADKNLDKKVLLRPDGTSLYITQDINMAVLRYKDFQFNQMIYVVGNEQQYHFQVLFKVFKALKFDFANKCHHFSYGMIELPDGKMKSREGNVIDTDDLIEEAIKLAKAETQKREAKLSEKKLEKRANKIAMAAIKFSILKHDPLKNFVFDLKKSLEFEGDTGPYVLYSYVRIKSILKKYNHKINEKINFSLLNTNLDKKVLNLLKDYKKVIINSARDYKPSLITNYLLELSSTFNKYYNQNPILNADNPERIKARILLIHSVSLILKSGLNLLGIDTVEKM
jgi:arginyl-tRNA synthetase